MTTTTLIIRLPWYRLHPLNEFSIIINASLIERDTSEAAVRQSTPCTWGDTKEPIAEQLAWLRHIVLWRVTWTQNQGPYAQSITQRPPGRYMCIDQSPWNLGWVSDLHNILFLLRRRHGSCHDSNLNRSSELMAWPIRWDRVESFYVGLRGTELVNEWCVCVCGVKCTICVRIECVCFTHIKGLTNGYCLFHVIVQMTQI